VFISDDMVHDTAFVHHCNTMFTHWVQNEVAYPDCPFETHYARSDGCKAQFANATHFLWISKQKTTNGIRMDWTFFCSCHGKCDCDPEGGSTKRHVACQQLRDSPTNSCKIAVVQPDLINFLDQSFTTPTKASTKKVGVYRRVINYVPSRGAGAVNRRIQHADTLDGSSKLRQISDIGIPGEIRVRRKSCHECVGCMDLNPSFCRNSDMCGESERKKLKVLVEQRNDSTRRAQTRNQIDDAFLIAENETIMIENDAAREPWMIGDVVKKRTIEREKDSCVYRMPADTQDVFGFFAKGDHVVDFQKYEPVAWGSSYFVRTDKIFPVYVENIRSRDVKLATLSDKARPTRRNPEGSQTRLLLSKDERDRILLDLTKDRADWQEIPNYSGQD
jgi:hypothetical protein